MTPKNVTRSWDRSRNGTTHSKSGQYTVRPVGKEYELVDHWGNPKDRTVGPFPTQAEAKAAMFADQVAEDTGEKDDLGAKPEPEWMREHPARWAGLAPVWAQLESEGFATSELESAIRPEPGIHGGDWPGFDVVLYRCRDRALAARYDHRFAGQPYEEWEAIEATVTPEERAAKGMPTVLLENGDVVTHEEHRDTDEHGAVCVTSDTDEVEGTDAVGIARTMASQAAMGSKRCTKAFLTRAWADNVADELRRLGMQAMVESRTRRGAPTGTHGWFVDATWPAPEEHLDDDKSLDHAMDEALREAVKAEGGTKAVSNARRAELAELLRQTASSGLLMANECGEAARALTGPTERELELDAIVHGADLGTVLRYAEAWAIHRGSRAMQERVQAVRRAIQHEAG